MDSFVFDVWTDHVESALRSRLFTISVSYKHINSDNIAWLMTLGVTSVDEGGSVIVTSRSLDVKPLQRRLSDALNTGDKTVNYTVVDPPRHGKLQVTKVFTAAPHTHDSSSRPR